MASVCGGSLALMDAGVPVKSPIAGIAMGMLLGNRGFVLDNADAMEFKVAGDAEGITAFRLDIKCKGLALETMVRALEQAQEGRLHIFGETEKAL